VRTIEIRVSQAKLPDTLNTMREWLDREKFNLSRYSHVTEADGIVIINVSFPDTDDPRLDDFHRQFGGAG
jgi:hypothetical protein